MTDLTAALDRFIEVSEKSTPGPWRLDRRGYQIYDVIDQQSLEVSQMSIDVNAVAIVAQHQLAIPLAKVAKAAAQVSAFTKPPWDTDVDRGDADIALDEALAELAKAAIE